MGWGGGLKQEEDDKTREVTCSTISFQKGQLYFDELPRVRRGYIKSDQFLRNKILRYSCQLMTLSYRIVYVTLTVTEISNYKLPGEEDEDGYEESKK